MEEISNCGEVNTDEIVLLLQCSCPFFFPSEATLITLWQSLALGQKKEWNPTPNPLPCFLWVRARAPGAYNVWGGSSAYTGFSHPRRIPQN